LAAAVGGKLYQNQIRAEKLEETAQVESVTPSPLENTLYTVTEEVPSEQAELFQEGVNNIKGWLESKLKPDQTYVLNRFLDATLSQNHCTSSPTQSWYGRFSSSDSYNKESFQRLFQQYVAERGTANFLKDLKGKKHFRVLAQGHENDPRYDINARLFEERVFQWIGESSNDVKACALGKYCK